MTKQRHAPYDGAGARAWGGRWNSPGAPVIYCSDTFAGSILEILAHSARPRTLPGPHHAVHVTIPDELVERLEENDLPGWEARSSPAALAFGDRWLEQARSAVLVVPSVPSRPVGRTVAVNPLHPEAHRIDVSPEFDVPRDERLF